MNFRIILFQSILLLQFCYDTISQYMPMGMHPMMQPMPGAMPMPMQMQMPMPGMQMGMQPSKIPVVVMPYYSKQQDKVDSGSSNKKKKIVKNKKHKKKRIVKKKHRSRSGSESGSDSAVSGSGSGSDENYYRAKPRHKSKGKKRRNMLTPVVSYVTKNGRVVYQTKIKNENVKDWLVKDKRRRADDSDDNLS